MIVCFKSSQIQLSIQLFSEIARKQMHFSAVYAIFNSTPWMGEKPH
jgi:hypothetical protein